MQNFVDYYSNMLARQLFRDRQTAKAGERVSHTPITDEDIISEQHCHDSLYDYDIFFNRGSGHRSANETQNQDETFLKRWLTFYQPDPGALPHYNNILTLEARRSELNQKHTQLNSPLLAGLMISVIIATLLSINGNPLLLLIPVGLFLLIWAKTRPDIKENALHLKRNQQLLEQQQALHTQFKNTSATDFPTEELNTFRKNYTLKLEDFLQDTLQLFQPGLSTDDMDEQLHSGKLRLYVLESRGILQIPDVGQQNNNKRLSLENLIHKTGDGWCAVQPYEELLGLTRLHYFYGVIRLEQGAIICSAFYDWVANRLHARQRDYCTYNNMMHIRQFETRFPEENALADELSDEVYQLHFGEPVNVISLSIRNGDQHCCTLPVKQPVRQTTLNHLPDTVLTRHLCRDAGRLVTDLGLYIRNHAPQSTEPHAPNQQTPVPAPH